MISAAKGKRVARKEKLPLVAGIDPGQRTGICAMAGEEIVEIGTVSREKAQDAIRSLCYRGLAAVGIEYSPDSHIYRRPGVSVRGMLKIAQSVERNRGYARELIAFCEGLGLEVIVLRPRRTK